MKKIIFYIYKKCWDIIANPTEEQPSRQPRVLLENYMQTLNNPPIHRPPSFAGLMA